MAILRYLSFFVERNSKGERWERNSKAESGKEKAKEKGRKERAKEKGRKETKTIIKVATSKKVERTGIRREQTKTNTKKKKEGNL